MAGTRKSKGSRNKPIVLDFRNVKTPVLVRPDDKDRFATTEAEAAKACRLVDAIKDFEADFKEFLAHVHDWSEAHSDTVLRSYVAPSLYGLDVFVLTKGDEQRFGFDDEVSHLDIELAQKFARCPAHVTHMPEQSTEALESFFSPDRALQVYG